MRTADDARTSDETRARPELNIRRSVAELAVAWLLIFGLVTSIGVLITKVFEPTQPIYGEDRINRWLQSFRTPTWDTVTAVGSRLAETTTMIALVFLAVVVMRLAFGRWRESIYVLVSMVGETIMFLVVGLLISRHRPDLPHLDRAPPTSSFPSGHTAAALTYYGSIAIAIGAQLRRSWLRHLLFALALLITLFVATSRLYRGMHHPTDILGSLVLGGLWLTATTRVLMRDQAQAAR